MDLTKIDFSKAQPVVDDPPRLRSRTMPRKTHRFSAELTKESRQEKYGITKTNFNNTTPSPSSSSVNRLNNKQLELFNKLLQELNKNLAQISKNIRRPNWFIKLFEHEKKAETPKVLKEHIYKTLDNGAMESPCEKIVPICDPKTSKLYTDHELRQKVKEILDQLTSWTELKDAISSTFKNSSETDLFDGADSTGTTPFYWSDESTPREVKEKPKKKGSLRRLMSSLKLSKNKKGTHFNEFVQRHEKSVPREHIKHLVEARRSLDLHSPMTSKSGINLDSTFFGRSKSVQIQYKASSIKAGTEPGIDDEKSNSLNEPVLQRLQTQRRDSNPNSIPFHFEHKGRHSFGASSSTNPAGRNPLYRSLSVRSDSSISNRIDKINKISPIEEQEITEGRGFEHTNPLRRSLKLLQRSSSGRQNPNVSQHMTKSPNLYNNTIFEEGIIEDISVLCEAKWQKIEHGLMHINDEQLKHDLFDHFRRANYLLQLVILQSALYRQPEYGLNIQRTRAKILNDENMLIISKELFLQERNHLLASLNLLLALHKKNGAEALKELGITVIGHWDLLYEHVSEL
ncbi:hypothetical protein niasHT_001329 [Heterodera trifolii]|uniref:Uncharacterized protein n=1 Tax=Heterodera trifolii TaxID=157864 RepID=A0ABD2LMV8_9BILA